tara:strand:+ start:442 stop:801 length:360 start_codon:yes stop_codon:yes gene_type:complete
MDDLIRNVVLAQAKDAVKERGESYGKPSDNMMNCADLVQAHLGVPISPFDIGVINILQKISRLQNDPFHIDSWVDIAGYAAITCEALYDSLDTQPPQEDQQNIVPMRPEMDLSDLLPEE